MNQKRFATTLASVTTALLLSACATQGTAPTATTPPATATAPASAAAPGQALATVNTPELGVEVNTPVGQRMMSRTSARMEQGQPVSGVGAYKRELVYLGIVGTTINIQFREFVTDLDKPVFTQDIQLDLATSKRMQFKGARISILGADAQSIRFRVSQHLFN